MSLFEAAKENPNRTALEALLRTTPRLLVITGAGCSTGSGISDYRDEEGEWKHAPPIQHQDFMRSIAWRKRYWARSQRGYPTFLRAQPNLAHVTLAAWEAQHRLIGTITQNVDGLHQRAGHKQVIDLHGRLDEVVCMTCFERVPRAQIQERLEQLNPHIAQVEFAAAPDGDARLLDFDYEQVKVPECLTCGGDSLKPAVVFYGDSVPKPIVERCYRWVDEADAVLVVGSSLMVYSSFRFVRRAHERGIPIAAINRGVTRADEWLTVKVDAECGSILASLSL